METIPIRLLRDGVVVRREKRDENKGGLIILPPGVTLDKSLHPSFEAVVLRVGPGRRVGKREEILVEPKLKVGDRILVGKWGTTNANKAPSVRELGDDVFLMSEQDVMAVLESDEVNVCKAPPDGHPGELGSNGTNNRGPTYLEP